MRLSRFLAGTFLTFVYGFLLTPFVVVILTSLNAADYLSFPPQALSWRWYGAFFGSASFLTALWTSILVAALTAPLAALIGTPAAIYFVRHMRKYREAFRFAVLSPLILPEILTAIALLFLFNQTVGTYRSIGPLIVSHVVITLPFVFLTVSSALYNLPPNVEEAARTLGADARRTFVHVTFPLIKSGVVTGMLLSFIVSFDNVNLSLLLKPQGQTTLPILLMDNLRYNFDATTAAASVVSALLTLSIVLLIDRLYGLSAVRF